jgi:DNA/RNA endonuclease G (NUC1)
MSHRLDGKDRKELREILMEAFDHKGLERALDGSLSRKLGDLVSDSPFRDQVFEMIGVAEREGWLDGIVQVLVDEVPARVDLIGAARAIMDRAKKRSNGLGAVIREKRYVWVTIVLIIVAAAWLVRDWVITTPNFIVKVMDGSAPLAGHNVLVGRATANGLASNPIGRKTNSNGEAFFRLAPASDYLYLPEVEVVKGNSKRNCQLPAFSKLGMSITYNLKELKCGEGSGRGPESLRVARRPTRRLNPAQEWISKLPVDPVARRSRAPFGLPIAPVVFDRIYYTLGYDPDFLVPRWVSFTVDSRRTIQLRREPDAFQPDPQIPETLQSRQEDYKNNPYDRGNLIRRRDALWGDGGEAQARAAELETFYFSVIVPQPKETNQISWRAVEDFTTKSSTELGPIYVVAGPVYSDTRGNNMPFLVIGPGRTPVPTALFRVLLRKTPSGTWRTIAFIVPNDGSSERDYKKFARSVADVEAMTHLKFFPDLAADQVGPLKANAAVEQFFRKGG